LIEVVVAEVDVEVVANFLQTPAELTSMPSLELKPLLSASDTKRRDFASNATKRATVSSTARS
jgi:hypothetical protein